MANYSPATQRKRERQVEQLRTTLLEQAGWPLERRLTLLAGALNVYKEQLGATKTIITAGDVVEVADNQSRLRAAEAITTLEGVNVGSTHDGASGTAQVAITINAPWFQPEPTICSDERLIETRPETQASDIVEITSTS